MSNSCLDYSKHGKSALARSCEMSFLSNATPRPPQELQSSRGARLAATDASTRQKNPKSSPCPLCLLHARCHCSNCTRPLGRELSGETGASPRREALVLSNARL
ncbi:hypothetical protein KIL84_009131 [Mauremys mutica]|uniref:Uncharacterized protein n=1 Tax=Mauremys mutica TaxID=74926 RepID=A0A9D3XJJ4_9SAUR|nr:hypothetical protein KIL84_009131 [Mauremys mutica]